jgi:hypothetical protein
MTKYLVSYTLIKGMECIIEADSEKEAIELMKEDPEDGRELDHEIENIDVCEY